MWKVFIQMRNLIVGLNCRVMLFFALIFTLQITAQTIVSDPIGGFAGGRNGAFNLETKEIYLTSEHRDSKTLWLYLHEFGHFIWTQIDSSAFKQEYLKYLSKYNPTEHDIREDFANFNYMYMMGWFNPDNWEYKYFYNYYYKSKK